MPDPPPARVFLRPIGSPLAIGMSGLAIASLVQSGFDLGWTARSQAPEVGLVLIAVPFVLQLLAAVFFYLARDAAAGAAVGVLSTTWLAIGLLHLASPGHTSGALGLLLVADGPIICFSALAVASGNPLAGGTLMLAALRLVVAGIYELTAASGWEDAAGAVGLAVCACAAYCALAFELEDKKRGAVLPTFRRGRGEASMSGGWADQIDDVANEAGVRQTS